MTEVSRLFCIAIPPQKTQERMSSFNGAIEKSFSRQEMRCEKRPLLALDILERLVDLEYPPKDNLPLETQVDCWSEHMRAKYLE